MMNGVDVNTLIEQGKRKIEARRMQGQLVEEERERENQAKLEAERAKFVAEAIEPLKAACEGIGTENLGTIDQYRHEMSVVLSVPLCTTVRAEFSLESMLGVFNPPREDRTWKLRRYLVPDVRLVKGADELEEPWTADDAFWSHGYMEATEVAELDEALALASDRFVELALLEQEAKEKNEAVKVERARDAEREEKRFNAQRAAFYPFAWYVVHYSIVASDNDGNHEVDQASFTCLRSEPDDGWYFAIVQGKSVKPSFVTLVERMVCTDSEHLPYWCPTVETEWGTIRIPPLGVERVETDGLRAAFAQAFVEGQR